MPFQIIKNDITNIQVDAVVVNTRNAIGGKSDVNKDYCLTKSKQITEKLRRLLRRKTGEIKTIKVNRQPVKYVFYTAYPVWKGGKYGEEKLLYLCYKDLLKASVKNGIKTIAFSLLSAVENSFPEEIALSAAEMAFSDFLKNKNMMIYLSTFGTDAYKLDSSLAEEVQQFIDRNYNGDNPEKYYSKKRFEKYTEEQKRRELNNHSEVHYSLKEPIEDETIKFSRKESDTDTRFENGSISHKFSDDFRKINDIINKAKDESFAQMLIRKIDEKGLKDSECYKKANIDKTLFSKIRSNSNYKPSKSTVIAFAISLEMNIEETKELLMKAGYALSNSNIFDIIVKYFIVNGNYNIFEINEVLFYYDQATLGSK